MDLADIAKAARAFQDAISGSYYEEHGISDDEAATGMLAAMEALGFADGASAEAIREVWKAQEAAELQECRDRETARRAAMTQEERDLEDLLEKQMAASRAALLNKIADDMFDSRPFLTYLRGKA